MKSISPLRLFVAICALMIGAHTQSFAATTTLTASNSSNNQDQINTALKKGGTVYLKSGTYTINGTINLVSNTILTGDRGAKIMLVKNANWATHKPMILGSSVSNVRISGFEIDGNRDNNTTSNGVATKCGKYYYDIIQLTGSSNIEIDHMYLHHNWNDIVLSKTTSNLNFHDNVVRQPGHDIVSIYNAGTTYVTNNCMRLYCNSAARAAGGAGPMYVASNYIARDVGAGGYGAIEVQQSSTSVYNCSNTIGDVATKYALLDGGTLHTGGCPSVPAMTTATKNCDVSALGAGAGSSSSSSSAGSSSSSSSSGASSSGTSSNTSGTSSSSSSSSSGSSSSSSTPAASVTTDTSSVHYVTAGTSTSQQNTINAAITKGGTVYLKAGTYTIDGTIILMSNVTLAGARGAKIKLANNANWPSNKPLILGSNVSNVKISGFEIDGNKANNGSSNGRTLKSGDDYYNLIGLISSSAVEISNMYMHDGFANAVFSKRTKNLNVHDNVIKNMNVEGVNAYRGGTTYVTNNCMRVIHGGARSDSTTPMYVASNDIAAVSTASNLGGIIVENEAGISMYVYNCSNNIHNVKATIGYMTGGTSSMVKTSGCPSVPTMSAATKSCSVSDLSSFTVTATGSTDTTSADSMSTSSLLSTSGTSSSGTSSSSSSSSSSASTATSTASTATAPTVTSSGSTTTLTAGNSTNQQVQINAALAKGGIVYLKAGVYTINGQITIGVDNTTLKGERGAVIKLVDKANWDPYVELVHVKAKNVRITGFEIDGNAPNNTTSNGDTCNCGREYYDIIFVDNTSNVEIDHMYLHDNWNDSILVKGSKNVNVHNNIFRRPGHDVVANYSRSSTVYITNNCIRTYCNSAIRAYSSGPVYAINNDISRETGYTGGYAAFEIQADNPQLYNCDNNVHNMKLVTVFLYGADSSNYHVGGCPISPAKALIVDSCSVSDIDKD